MGHRETQVDERTWKCLGNFEEEMISLSSPIPCNISFLKSDESGQPNVVWPT